MNYKDFGGNLPQFSQSNARVRQALPSHYQGRGARRAGWGLSQPPRPLLICSTESILRTLGTLGTVWQPQYLYSTEERSKGRITECSSGNLSPLTSYLSPLTTNMSPTVGTYPVYVRKRVYH